MKEFLNKLWSMIGLDKEEEGKKDERPHYFINSRKEIEGGASFMELFAAVLMVFATFFSKDDEVTQQFHYGVTAALLVASVLFHAVCYWDECFAKSMRNQSHRCTECSQKSNLLEPKAKKDDVDSTEEEFTKLDLRGNEEKDQESDNHNKPSENLEEELEKLKEKNMKGEEKLKEIEEELEKLRKKKIKKDEKLKKLTEEYEKDQAKWAQEKYVLDTTLHVTQSWHEYYYGLSLVYEGQQTACEQERVAWEQEKNELLAEVQSVTATSNIYRGVLHDLGY